ncbi:3'-5' DNA helicase [Thecaphora frezii]
MSDEFDEFDDGFDLAQLNQAELESLERLEAQPSLAAAAAAAVPQPRSTATTARNLPPFLVSSKRTPASARNPDDTFDDIIDDFDDELLLGIDELDSRLSGDKQQQPAATATRAAPGPLFFMPSSPEAIHVLDTAAEARVASATSAVGPSTTRPPPPRPTNGSAAVRTLSSSFARPSSNRSPLNRSSSGAHRQMTLFGDVAPNSSPAKILPVSPGHISASSSAALTQVNGSGAARQRQPTTKQWNRTAYAASGRRTKPKANGKGKGKGRESRRDEYGALIDGGDEDDDSDDGYGDNDIDGAAGSEDWDAHSSWQNKSMPMPLDPAAAASAGPPQPLQPMKHRIDREAAKTWVYPINMERRDYQHNIVLRSLFNNVLVALPTGLGKTFIAAVVILNFFRWYPQGKIVFLAPTRPLVDQQKIACHGICGLPWDTAIDLTGSTKRSLRTDHWEEKRIFYMTPQTFENDLRTGGCNPHDIVCLVVDEAHRATGKYAYCNVVSILMQSNPHFRVLALTATPGNNVERVQEVIDRLHIGVIEIRTEASLDIRRYVHKKHEEIVKVVLGRDLNAIRDKWARLMRTHMEPLARAGLLRQTEPTLLHPFAVRALYKDKRAMAILRERPQLYRSTSELADMATSMQHLLEQSVMIFYHRLLSKQRGVDANGKKAATKKQQASANSNSTVREIVRELEMMQDEQGRIVHPKMFELRRLVCDHFSNHRIQQMLAQEPTGEDEGGGTTAHETRVMVFCSFRECVNEIVDYLNSSGLKVTPFVGQATTKNGGRGMSQRDQERVIQQFKNGDFNVLVATSIGEEGLDIGDVDLTVCYEAVKDSVRMLQRVGRTGRKRDGKIIVLMSEGREEANWKTSKELYKSVQDNINSGLAVALYDDVDRMVPDDIKPEPLYIEVDQPKFEPSMVSDGRRAGRPKAAAAAQKRKRNSDPARNVPDGTLMGFLKASKLTKKRKSSGGDDAEHDDAESSDDPATVRRRKMLLNSSQSETDAGRAISASKGSHSGGADDDDDDDEDVEKLLQRGLFGARTTEKGRRANLSAEVSRQPSTWTPPPARSASDGNPVQGGGGSQGVGGSVRKRLGAGRALGASPRPPNGAATGPVPYIEILDSSRSADSQARPTLRSALRTFSSTNRAAAASGMADATPKAAGKQAAGKQTAGKQAAAASDDEFGSLQVDSDIERQIGDITQAVRPLTAATPRRRSVHSTSAKAAAASFVITSSSPVRDDGTVGSPPRPCRVAPHPLVAKLAADLEIEELDLPEDVERANVGADADAEEQRDASSPIKAAGRRRRGAAAAIARDDDDEEVSAAVGAAAGSDADSIILDVSDVDEAETMAADRTRPRGGATCKRPAPRRILATSSQSPPPILLAHPITGTGAASAAPSSSRLMGPPTTVPRHDADDSPLHARRRRRLVAAPPVPAPASTVETPNHRKARQGEGGGKKKKRIGASPTSRALFWYEAERETDEEVHGERDEEDEGVGSEEENEEDRRAVGLFEPTQAPKGYNQRSVYMGSLLTQNAPTPFKPRGNRTPFPGIGGRFGQQPSSSSHRGFAHTQANSQDSLDRYSEDSFVVNDDEEILYDSDAGPSSQL